MTYRNNATRDFLMLNQRGAVISTFRHSIEQTRHGLLMLVILRAIREIYAIAEPVLEYLRAVPELFGLASSVTPTTSYTPIAKGRKRVEWYE